MPTYIAAHNYAVFYAPEVGSITESTNGITPPTLPTAPLASTTVLLGYIPSTPELDRGLNNALGFAIGSANAAYDKRGVRNPKLSFTITITDIAFLQNAVRVSGKLPYLCFNLVIPNVRTIQIRFAKIEEIGLKLNAVSTGEAGEIQVDVQIEAVAVVPITALNPDVPALMAALNRPLFWHDVRTVTFTDSANATSNLRANIMSFSATIKHNLERKNERPNFGDHVPLSNTNYELLEHQINISGEAKLHGYLPAAFFDAVADSQNWGDTIIVISDTPTAGVDNDRSYALTLGDCFAQNYVEDGVDANGQLSSTVPFFAKTFELSDGSEDNDT